MNKKKILSLYTMILGLSGCNTDDPADIKYYSEIPAIYRYSDIPQRHIIETSAGTFLAPRLGGLSEPLNRGDLLLTNFEIDLLNQPYSDVETVSNLQIMRIYGTLARQMVADEISDFNDPIITIVDFDIVSNWLFFWFLHDAPDRQTYNYEMVYDDPEEADQFPALYIRAKKTNNPSGSNIEMVTCYGFDMTFFIAQNRLRDPNSTAVTFYVKCYAGEECNDCEEGYKLLLNGYRISFPIVD